MRSLWSVRDTNVLGNFCCKSIRIEDEPENCLLADGMGNSDGGSLKSGRNAVAVFHTPQELTLFWW